MQAEAAQKVKELFPNLKDVPTIDVCDAEGSEDQAAGELGKPFTETEDDEEWAGWVNWDALGGGSSDVADA